MQAVAKAAGIKLKIDDSQGCPYRYSDGHPLD
jgi:hypothetical protein